MTIFSFRCFIYFSFLFFREAYFSLQYLKPSGSQPRPLIILTAALIDAVKIHYFLFQMFGTIYVNFNKPFLIPIAVN